MKKFDNSATALQSRDIPILIVPSSLEVQLDRRVCLVTWLPSALVNWNMIQWHWPTAMVECQEPALVANGAFLLETATMKRIENTVPAQTWPFLQGPGTHCNHAIRFTNCSPKDLPKTSPKFTMVGFSVFLCHGPNYIIITNWMAKEPINHCSHQYNRRLCWTP